MIIETLFKGEPSMDNPPMITAPISVGQTFTYKGEKIVVLGINKTKYMFKYESINTKGQGYMSFKYYKLYYKK